MSVFSPEVSIQNTPLVVDGSAVTQPISGTVTANAGTGPFPISDNGGSITVDGTVAVNNFPGASTGTATVTNVSVSTTVATLSASNAAKTKVVVYNETGTLFVKLGTGATAASYSYRLTANTVLEVTGYHGVITGIKLSGTSAALVTEFGI